MAGSFKVVDCAAGVNGHCAELDRDSKIDSDFAHCFAEIGIGTFGILTPVAHDDKMTATQHHLVNSKVFEMAAIRQIHVFVVIGCVTDRFRKQWPYRISGSFWAPHFGAGLSAVPKPPSKAHVE